MMEFGESWAQVQCSARLGDRLRREEDYRIRTYGFFILSFDRLWGIPFDRHA